jgi:rubrerythrin
VSGGDRLPAALGGIPLETLDRDGALSETAEELALSDRGQFLRAGAFSLLVGGLALPSAARAAKGDSDRQILNYALSLEYLQAAFYTEAERLKSLEGKFRDQARVVGSHERAHVAALKSLLGKAAIKAPRFDFQGVTEDQKKFRETAVAFEDLGTAAYKAEAPKIKNPEYLAAAIRVHSVEARHAAWIRRLAGALPAPAAFDEPKSQKQVKRLVASTKFVVADPVTESSGKPQFTG